MWDTYPLKGPRGAFVSTDLREAQEEELVIGEVDGGEPLLLPVLLDPRPVRLRGQRRSLRGRRTSNRLFLVSFILTW